MEKSFVGSVPLGFHKFVLQSKLWKRFFSLKIWKIWENNYIDESQAWLSLYIQKDFKLVNFLYKISSYKYHALKRITPNLGKSKDLQKTEFSELFFFASFWIVQLSKFGNFSEISVFFWTRKNFAKIVSNSEFTEYS